ncbi:2,4-dienoyl-CoA reductase-like NADH-dependent reductase (Old Yellow Enzyme family) [Salsuginibacillus halophilus]|uniref:2,4-dienoyl-CoA reductase-like NADH-dependent reductase (Old Yellow Enzyme family) n=1 Tax=Salsuginibacillus halophilus TaxID=517424 RepID=A0A2P8H9U0_9BACI|nr:NADH-dependent flavin oxidoreductase [Salsuginibacillus halophilus]PSL42939.1 2,4-dienoyl-CoA reductase-like NADH-dependent reductase (Old Yellow Enzyme family) [Salsuginibacillus halophilus]
MHSFLEPFTFNNGATLRNRIMLAPMTNFASAEDGETTVDELAYYRERSTGTGAVITACANVTADGKGFPGEIGVYDDSLIDGLADLAETIQAEGAKAILQIFHGGRMCPPDLLPDGQPVSASAIPAERENAATPRALEHDEIEEIVEAFANATRRAIKAGFDGVEIHGANTYLIQQFYSPHSNQRDDTWGGSRYERMTFPLAVTRAVAAAALEAPPEFIVGYRFSPEEREEPGITMDDTLELVRHLAEEDLDYLHVSVQDFFAGSMRDENDTRSRVEMIQAEVGEQIPVIGVGSLYTVDDANRAMATGVPLLALGRELIVDPDWVEKAADGREEEIRTELSLEEREDLVVPETLWNTIGNTPGWFPVKEHREEEDHG